MASTRGLYMAVARHVAWVLAVWMSNCERVFGPTSAETHKFHVLWSLQRKREEAIQFLKSKRGRNPINEISFWPLCRSGVLTYRTWLPAAVWPVPLGGLSPGKFPCFARQRTMSTTQPTRHTCAGACTFYLENLLREAWVLLPCQCASRDLGWAERQLTGT
jgi:hypothetical protein